jgi:hypothetical protein
VAGASGGPGLAVDAAPEEAVGVGVVEGVLGGGVSDGGGATAGELSGREPAGGVGARSSRETAGPSVGGAALAVGAKPMEVTAIRIVVHAVTATASQAREGLSRCISAHPPTKL